MVSVGEIHWASEPLACLEHRYALEEFHGLSREDLEVYTRSLQLDLHTIRLTLHDTMAALALTVDQRDRATFLVQQLRSQSRSADRARAA